MAPTLYDFHFASSPVLLALPLFFLIGKLLVNSFTGPARHVKGPWHTRFTNLRLKYAAITGRSPFYIDDLHEKYGPYVRISPTEVAVADLQAMKIIHKVGSKYLKAPFYSRFTRSSGDTSTFSSIDAAEHARKRRLVSRPFSRAFLTHFWEPTVRERAELCASRIKDGAIRGSIDVFQMWMLLASDISTEIIFGESYNMLESGKVDDLIRILKQVARTMHTVAELPFLFLLRYIPKSSLQKTFSTQEDLNTKAQRAVAVARSEADESNIFAAVIKDSEKEGGIGDMELMSEARSFIVAGTDTTAVTLTYLTWAVLQRQELQIALEDEVAKLPVDFKEIDLMDLPLLNAVIEETLRLYAPVQSSLPRVVPPGGAHLGGYFLPEGCIVSTQAYTLHRDPKIWKNPLDYDPKRWLLDKNDPASAHHPDAKSAFHPWGGGSRICIGMHLAQMELRYAVAMFFRTMRGAKLATSTTPESMEFNSYFINAPVSHKCEITLI